MPEIIAETVLKSAPGLLILGGFACLKLVIVGGSVWPLAAGDPLAPGIRKLTAVLGIACLSVGGLIAYQAAVPQAAAAAKTSPQSAKNARDLEQLTARVSVLEGGQSTASGLTAVNEEIRTLRAGVIAEDPSGASCTALGTANGAETSSNAEWVPHPATQCQRFKNAQWTVEIQGYLDHDAAKLGAGLDELALKYVVGPAPVNRYKVSETGLGIVFDSGVPADLICRVKDLYYQATGRRLELATTQQNYRVVSKNRISSFGIRLGVSFETSFDIRKDNRMHPADWDALCDSPKQMQFDAWFEDHAAGFRPLAQPPAR